MFPLILLIVVAVGCAEENQDTLVLTHVLFRHGDRNPETNNLYQKDPHYGENNYPEGYGQLTKKGKIRAHELGIALRHRYTNFLPEEYNIKLIEPRSSDFNRTKDSLQVVLNGLFPPTPDQIFLEGLKWQPIAYNYVQRDKDKELFCFGCPNWEKNFEEYLNSSEGKRMLEQYKSVFDNVTSATGEKYTFLRLYYLYFGFEIQKQLNITLPEWTGAVYPQPLRNLTTDYYTAMLATTTLKKMAGGYLLKKIVQDTEAKVNNVSIPPERQMFLYAGHENNIASILEILGVWENDKIAPYCSYVLLELHNVNGTYGMKIFYQDSDDTGAEPKLLKMPNCSEFCPFDDFKKEINEYISIDDTVCYSSAISISGSIIIFILSIWMVVM